MENTQRQALFETVPVPRAVTALAVPTILSSLVMVLYNLADTYFVGMLNDPIQNAAVTLAAPVLLAFNAVNNLFGVGSSSMMSRALGRKDYDTVASKLGLRVLLRHLVRAAVSRCCARSSAQPLLTLLGADGRHLRRPPPAIMHWTVHLRRVPRHSQRGAWPIWSGRRAAALHASIGTMSGCLLNIVLDPIFILPWGLNMGAAGAGLATFLSNCVACLYFFVLLAREAGQHLCVRPADSCSSFEPRDRRGACAAWASPPPSRTCSTLPA